MPGRFAPVFKKVGSSQKLTIVWKDFSPVFKTKLNIMAWLLNQNSEDTALVVLKMPLDWELEMIPKQKTKLNRSVNYSRNTINENWPTSKDWKN